MSIISDESNKYITLSISALLLIVVFAIFIIPLFPFGLHRTLYNISFTLIFLLSAIALNKDRTRIFILASLVVLIEWLSILLELSVVFAVAFIAYIIFFIMLVVLFIRQITQAKNVTPQLILGSVNGYLMLGISFSILIALLCVIDPTAFSFKNLSETTNAAVLDFANYIYYGFVTLTTLGYGDIVPLTPAGKSLSIFISFTGQMYIAIIIATIVSKYLRQRSTKD